jgi:hypothetical protein
MPLTVKEKAHAVRIAKETEAMLRAAGSRRDQFILGSIIGEAAIEFMANTFGRKQAWEWLQRISDQLMDKELP